MKLNTAKTKLRTGKRNSGFTKTERIRKMKEATERGKLWGALSKQEQLQELDKRLGKDQGAVKQRAKIKKEIELIAKRVKEASR